MTLSTNDIKKTVLFHFFFKVFNHSILMKLPGILQNFLKKKCKPINSRIRVLFQSKNFMIMLM